LYDLSDDPHELRNLAGDAVWAAVESALHDELLAGWNPDELHRQVLASQRRRLFIKSAGGASGRFPNWSFQASTDDSRRFVRGSGAAAAKARARFPFVPPKST
jgi:choline-sulfatase